MVKKLKSIIPIIIFMCFIISCSNKTNYIINTYYPDDTLMWNHIMNSKPEMNFDDIPIGAIIPHHAITSEDVASFYKGLSKKISPKTIFIICPNHYEEKTYPIISALDIEYKTVYGTVSLNKNIINNLVSNNIAKIDDKSFLKEHGIFFHTAFIKKYFPDACIVPILLTWDNSKEKNVKLAEFIKGYYNKDTFVIASVDFSHYQSKNVADFHDETSYKTIVNFDFDKIYDLEIDSPPSVFTLLKLMEFLNVKKAIRLFHSNSDLYLKRNEKETTSHQYFVFYKGSNNHKNQYSILITGNILIKNENLFIRTNWNWDRNYNEKQDNSVGRYLKNIRGKEDRFLIGSDLYIFDIKEINKPVSYNLDQRIVSIVKFNNEKKEFNNQLQIIKKLNLKDNIIIVLFFNNGKIVTNEIIDKLHDFIRNGTDVICVKNSEIKKDEIYLGKPILLSLGNFITEKSDSFGEIVGIIINENNYKIYKFPLILKKGIPEYKF